MTTLQNLYDTHTGKVSDKWSIYLSVYERVLLDYKNLPINLLEIGVQNGGSLEIWGKYFSQATHIIGCDINPKCADLRFDDARIKLVVGDANNEITKHNLLDINPTFDIIIDDGSHTSSDIIRTFALYFDRLNDGGVYIAEDLHCSYWQEFDGGLYHPNSSINFFKHLVDVLNYKHWGIDVPRNAVLENFYQRYDEAHHALDLAHIHSIEFIDSMCVIKKRVPNQNILGLRQVVGQEDLVVSSALLPNGQENTPPKQANNPWLISPRIQIAELNNLLEHQISKAKQKITDLEYQVSEKEQAIQSCTQKISELEQTVTAIQHQSAEKDPIILDREQQLLAQKHKYNKYKKLWTTRLVKPFIKTEQALSSANNLRKGFRRLVKAKGSIGKAYQHVRRLRKAQGFRAVKTLLRAPHGGLDAFNSRINYDDWVKRYDTLSVADIEPMKLKLAAQKLQPLISIVMPTYNPKIEWLIEAIESVQAQIYPHWELCIADDCSSDPRVQETLQAMAQKDKRIKVVTREKNGHISAASNSALELAQGEWIALMDHDDLLPIHALYCVAQTIHQHPDAQMIYSDEDKINEQGTRLDPYFKPDWNIDLFYSHNMFSHLGVYRKTLIDHVGGFRLGFEGAQDYDLALRCIEQIDHQHIHHIPRVLYHWRVHAQSTAQSSEAKPYAAIAGQKALNEHFQRINLNAQSTLLDFGMYRTQYALPEKLPLVSLIIPTKNAQKLVMQCVESILEKTTYPNYEIIIVDNASDDAQAIAYFKQLANEHSNIRVIRDDRPFNYSQLNNNAVQYTNGELIGLINNDIEVISPDWLGEMVSIALQKNVGAVGAKLYYPNNTIQHAGVVIGLGGVANHVFKHAYRDSLGYFGRAKLISSYSAVTAACLIIKKSIFTEVGELDEENLKVAFNDVDFCLKVRSAGYRNVWTSFAELYHHESVSRGADDIPEKRQRFEQEVAHMRKKWQTDKFEDPAYSPNLTLDFEDFSFACPPRVSKI